MSVCIFIALASYKHMQIMFIDIWCFGAVYTMEIALKFRTEKVVFPWHFPSYLKPGIASYGAEIFT